MSEIEDDKVRALILALCNSAMGQLPKGSFVTMVVRLPPEEGQRTDFVISNDADPSRVIVALLKLASGDHPDVESIDTVPVEPTRDALDGCSAECLAPVYRAPIHHAPGCPNEEA